MIRENEISSELEKLISEYALTGKIVTDISPEFKELVELYFNDKNSSTLRQYATSLICGYTNSFKKLGYDAIDKYGKHKEVKPTNRNSKTSKKTFNGWFGFSDYTKDRFDNDVKNEVNILQSFFVDGRLIYIIEFPIVDITHKMDYLLEKYAGKQYIRKAEFTFADLNVDNIEIKYITPDISEYTVAMTKKLYSFIISKHVPIV